MPVQPVWWDGAQPGAVVAVEVLVEEQVVLPRGVALQPFDPAEARPPAVRSDQEKRDQTLPEVGADRRRRQWRPEPVGYSSVNSSPKKRW